MDSTSNISKYYFLLFFSYQHFICAILILYFLDLGYSLIELIIYGLTLQFVLASILEIPTGVFADKHSRKTSLIYSGIMMVFASFLLLFAENKYLFIFSIILISFSHAFYSGALQAWFYDSLKELKKESSYKKIEGKAQLITQIGMAISTIIGAYLFQIYTKIPFMLLFLFQVFWLISIISIKEPKRTKNNERYIIHFKKSLKYIFSKKKLALLLIVNISLILFYLSFMYVFNQIYLLELDFSPLLMGIFLVILRIIMSFGSFIANKIKITFNIEFSSLLIIQSIIVFLIGLLNNFISLILIIILFFIFGIYSITLSNEIQKLSSSKYRATIFSIQSLINNIIFGFGVLLFGIIVDIYSTSLYFIISSIFILCSFIIFLIKK